MQQRRRLRLSSRQSELRSESDTGMAEKRSCPAYVSSEEALQAYLEDLKERTGETDDF